MLQRWRRRSGEGQTPVTSTQVLLLSSPLSLSFSAGKSNIGQHDMSARPSVRLLALPASFFPFFFLLICLFRCRQYEASSRALLLLISPLNLDRNQKSVNHRGSTSIVHLIQCYVFSRSSASADTTGFWTATGHDMIFEKERPEVARGRRGEDPAFAHEVHALPTIINTDTYNLYPFGLIG